MNKISINLIFAGVILPVTDCEDGNRRVPLKPICDAIGVEWDRQRKKVQDGYLARRLGTCTIQMYWAGQDREVVAIRLDRVASYLMSINPDAVRGAGNESAADYLEAKHQEWDDLIHAYEQQHGDLFRTSQYRKAMALVRIDRMRDPALKRIALTEIGVSLEEAAAANPNGDLFAA